MAGKTTCNRSDSNRDLGILVAADDNSGRETLRDLLSSWGFVAQAVQRNQVLEQAQTFSPHVLLIDLKEHQKDGETILPELQTRGIEVATVVMAEEADLHSLERTSKHGSYDVVSKPINPSNLRVLLNELATQLRVSDENLRLRRTLIDSALLLPIILHA